MSLLSHNHHDQEHFSRDEHTLFFSYGMEKEQERLEIVKSRKKSQPWSEINLAEQMRAEITCQCYE